MSYQAPPGNFIQHPDNPLLEFIEAIFGPEHPNTKIRTGSGTVKWGVKGFDSLETTVETGLTSCVLIGQPYTGGGGGSMGLVSNVGGTFKVKMHTDFEVAVGAEVEFFWVAIGE